MIIHESSFTLLLILKSSEKIFYFIPTTTRNISSTTIFTICLLVYFHHNKAYFVLQYKANNRCKSIHKQEVKLSKSFWCANWFIKRNRFLIIYRQFANIQHNKRTTNFIFHKTNFCLATVFSIKKKKRKIQFTQLNPIYLSAVLPK